MPHLTHFSTANLPYSPVIRSPRPKLPAPRTPLPAGYHTTAARRAAFTPPRAKPYFSYGLRPPHCLLQLGSLGRALARGGGARGSATGAATAGACSWRENIPCSARSRSAFLQGHGEGTSTSATGAGVPPTQVLARARAWAHVAPADAAAAPVSAVIAHPPSPPSGAGAHVQPTAAQGGCGWPRLPASREVAQLIESRHDIRPDKCYGTSASPM